MSWYQTPGRRPPPITGRFVNTVTRGWVGAPNGRTPFQISWRSRWFFRSMSVHDSESRSFEYTFGWVFLRPFLAQDRPRNYFFRGFWKVFETFFSNICGHSERYRNLLAGIFEILTFYENIAFPLSPVWARNILWRRRETPTEYEVKTTTTIHLCSIQLYSTCIVGEPWIISSACTSFISTVDRAG